MSVCSKCKINPKYKDSTYCYPCLNEYLVERNRYGFKKSVTLKSESAHEKAKFLSKVKDQKIYEVVETAINNYYDDYVKRTSKVNWHDKIIKK